MDPMSYAASVPGLEVFVPTFGLWGGLALAFFVLLVVFVVIDKILKVGGIWIMAALFISAVLSLGKAMGLY